MAPKDVTIEGMNSNATYFDPVVATCFTGSTLDWFLVSGSLAINAETHVEEDSIIHSHCPVYLKIGGKLSEDLGSRIRRPTELKEQLRRK